MDEFEQSSKNMLERVNARKVCFLATEVHGRSADQGAQSDIGQRGH